MESSEQTSLLVEGLTSYPKALAALNEFDAWSRLRFRMLLSKNSRVYPRQCTLT